MLTSGSKIQRNAIVAERDRRGPRQQDQEPQEPAAAEGCAPARARGSPAQTTTIACEMTREHGTCSRARAGRSGCPTRARKFARPTQWPDERARRGVGEARGRSRARAAPPTSSEDEDHRGRDQDGRETPGALKTSAPACGPHPYRERSPCHCGAIVTNVLRCAPAWQRSRWSSLSKVYGDGTRAVSGLDLEIEDGEFVVFVGPSGCGKTTALRMVAGLEEITSGDGPGRRRASSTTCRRRTATWRWSSRTTRSTRT